MSANEPSAGSTAGRSPSLHVRLLVAASLGLVAFLGLTGLTLDAAFRDSALSAVRDRLQGQIYTLLASAELTRSGELDLPDALPEPRLSRPGSGLYAAVLGEDFAWHSESALGRDMPWLDSLAPGATTFEGPMDTAEEAVFRLSQGVAWEQPDGGIVRFTFNVAENTDAFHEQVGSFRDTLWFWLGGAAVLLLVLQWLLLRWSLRPVRAVSRELHAVEEGERDQLGSEYPEELKALTDHINAFIRAEREHLERYRNTLADLAHSLKTPLAVLRSGLDDSRSDGPDREKLRQQVDRMDELVAYRLKRAAHAGARTLGVRTEVGPVAGQIVEALDKVHAGRGVSCSTELEPGAAFPGEEGDLYELLGNLLDNAYKWARSRVELRAKSPAGGHRRGLELTVTDDGPGIDTERADRLIKRGVRGDERVDGQGLGLAMVSDIVRAYGGRLEFDRAASSGTIVRVTIPGR